MTLQTDLAERRSKAIEAQQFLAHPMFREAFGAVSEYLHEQALACDPDNKDKAQRIVLSQQLLDAVQREVTRKVQDGEMAQVHMSEIERRRGLRLFRR